MKTNDHAEKLAEALRNLIIGMDTDDITASDNANARLALAAWERHNETTKGDDRVKADV